MDILPTTNHYFENKDIALLHKKMDTDEEIVRRELIRVWTKLLEKYARPGAYIPSEAEIRQDLLVKGVDAAIEAVIDEHWFVFSFMIREEIHRKVEKGLARFNLDGFIEDVRIAQSNQEMLRHLREKIRNHVMFEDF